jgi:hypothetical protein
VDEFYDFLGSLGSAIGTTAANYVLSGSTLGTVIRLGQNAGMSGRGILSAYRQAGGKTSNSTFWQINRAVKIGSNPVSAETMADWYNGRGALPIPGGKSGSFRVQMRGFYQTVDEEGNIEQGYQQFTLHQSELDLTGALADATSIWSDNSDTESFPGQLLALEVTGVYQYTGQ